ncbi:MAG: aldehyde dehydrogenase family protein [Patescibacteria group bacterium]
MNEREIKKKTCELIKTIREKDKAIEKALLGYESYETACFEIQRSLDCLQGIDKEMKFLTSGEIETFCAFFPINLPLYSFILFGIIPSFMANHVYIRPPELVRKILTELNNLLEIEVNFSEISLINSNRQVFLDGYASVADVVLFVGKYSNAEKIKQVCSRSLFLYNGAGINPIIVAESADIEVAVEKTVEMRTFNSGQDCAGPDVVFVHHKIYNNFLKILLNKVVNIKVGDYSDKRVRIGKLCDFNQFSYISKVFNKYHKNILCGGNIDYFNEIVSPTIITTGISPSMGYQEYFAPIFHIVCYKNETELSSYFKNQKYQDHAMYLSLFGDSSYVENIKHSIIFKNQIINDVERGNFAYGGYGKKASFVSHGGMNLPKPILISKEISHFLTLKK